MSLWAQGAGLTMANIVAGTNYRMSDVRMMSLPWPDNISRRSGEPMDDEEIELMQMQREQIERRHRRQKEYEDHHRQGPEGGMEHRKQAATERRNKVEQLSTQAAMERCRNEMRQRRKPEKK